MTITYLITGTNVVESSSTDAVPQDAVAVTKPKDLHQLSLADITALYNASAPPQIIKRFRSKTEASTRTWERLPKLVMQGQTVEDRRAWLAGKKFKPLVKKNPRENGKPKHTWDTIWLKHPKGLTFEQYLELGGSAADLSHDHRLNRLKVVT
jgi:hypothetical protein